MPFGRLAHVDQARRIWSGLEFHLDAGSGQVGSSMLWVVSRKLDDSVQLWPQPKSARRNRVCVKNQTRQTGSKSVEFWFVIREYLVRNCMLTWKSELQSLNCCIRWTASVASMKFAGSVAWIPLYAIWKSGSNMYCHCWNTKVFRGFLAHTLNRKSTEVRRIDELSGVSRQFLIYTGRFGLGLLQKKSSKYAAYM